MQVLFLLFSIGGALAADPLLRTTEGLRYEYLRDPEGVPHLVDTWAMLSGLARAARYDPNTDNQYHLFTRQNPTVSQPLLNGNQAILAQSNFRAHRKTVFMIHGWMGSATAASNTVVVPALLASNDVNVIVLDWSVGAAQPSFPNALASARVVATFINWLSAATGQTGDDIIIVGFSLGAQQAGMVGRHASANISYIVALDPPKRGHDFEFRSDDAVYTEVIHTNVLEMGTSPLGHVDFYPNGGDNNPGCGGGGGHCNHSRSDDAVNTEVIHTNVLKMGTSPLGHVDFYPNGGDNNPGCGGGGGYCNHSRAYFFFAESLVTGGFTGVECATYQDALNGACNLPRTLQMGGLTPKTGTTGIFYLETNAAPPFSRG